MSDQFSLNHFATPATLTLLGALNNLLKDIHEDLGVTLVGGALRDQHYNWKFSASTQANIKDFDFIITGPHNSYFDEICNALTDNTKFNKYIDSYHSPRIAARGLSGIFKFNYLGMECDILCYEGDKSLSKLISEFDADVNQVALSWNYNDPQVFYTKKFKDAFTNQTYKLVCREEVYDAFLCPEPKLQAREMKRLMNLQYKLPRFEMLDFPEFMELLDTIQHAEDEGLLDKQFSCAPSQNLPEVHDDNIPC
ncbi:nucleotidyltransferase [Vibrio phage 526E57-1]